MSKHTPGRWIAMKYPDVKGWTVTAERTVARVPVGRESEANARLIAASPEMLEALKQIKRNLIAAGNASPLYFGALTMAEVAIAKAEGRDE